MQKKYSATNFRYLFLQPFKRRVVRVVEGARLESVYTRKGIEGSNPSLSADMLEEKFFVYVLQSLKDFSFYTGKYDDLDRRMSNTLTE